MIRFLAGVGLGALLLVAMAVSVFANESDAESLEGRGLRILLSAKPACRTCHNPKLQSLEGVGDRLSEQEIKDWIRKPSKMLKKAGKRGKMPPYRFTDDELEAVVAFLKSI